jgi:hypothetical protein
LLLKGYPYKLKCGKESCNRKVLESDRFLDLVQNLINIPSRLPALRKRFQYQILRKIAVGSFMSSSVRLRNTFIPQFAVLLALRYRREGRMLTYKNFLFTTALD